MNPVVKTITLIIMSINGLIDSLNNRTVEAIKMSFFLVISILVITGGIMGYRSGMKNAQIKSPPLIKDTNDSFEYDIKQEHRGDFSSLLDSKLRNEVRNMDPKKMTYPAQEYLMPEADQNIIEPESTKKFKSSPDTMHNESPIEDMYFKKQSRESVKPLEKKLEPLEADDRAMKELRKNNAISQQDSSHDSTSNSSSTHMNENTNRQAPPITTKDKEIFE